MAKINFYHIPWIVWLGIILTLSFIPGDKLPIIKIDWISIDTVVHFLMYFALSALTLLGFLSKMKKSEKKMNLSNLWLYGIIVLAGILIGYSVELIQENFIQKRYFGIKDVVANSFGTIFGAIAFSWIGRKLI